MMSIVSCTHTENVRVFHTFEWRFPTFKRATAFSLNYMLIKNKQFHTFNGRRGSLEEGQFNLFLSMPIEQQFVVSAWKMLQLNKCVKWKIMFSVFFLSFHFRIWCRGAMKCQTFDWHILQSAFYRQTIENAKGKHNFKMQFKWIENLVWERFVANVFRGSNRKKEQQNGIEKGEFKWGLCD